MAEKYDVAKIAPQIVVEALINVSSSPVYSAGPIKGQIRYPAKVHSTESGRAQLLNRNRPIKPATAPIARGTRTIPQIQA